MFVCKFGFDTAENEPEYESKISLIFVSLISAQVRLLVALQRHPHRREVERIDPAAPVVLVLDEVGPPAQESPRPAEISEVRAPINT